MTPEQQKPFYAIRISTDTTAVKKSRFATLAEAEQAIPELLAEHAKNLVVHIERWDGTWRHSKVVKP